MARQGTTYAERSTHVGAEISTPIADAIDLWRITMRRREEDQRTILHKAASELFKLLKVDATVHPGESHSAACQAVATALADLGQDLPADEARRILAEAEEGKENEDDEATDEKEDRAQAGRCSGRRGKVGHAVPQQGRRRVCRHHHWRSP
jgi:hypothetical protein